ncbi:MAG: hypothetical protein PWR07_1570, partial [Bacillota bacterium]|nr:hypothetical protein [Bacillota bacterium]
HVEPGYQRTSVGFSPGEARGGWVFSSHISNRVGPPGTTHAQILVLWGPATHGHLGEWLREDQVAGEVGPQGTISARSLVTRGPDPASWWLERREGGSLVTRFRTGLFPQGPSARTSWSFEDQRPWASGKVVTRGPGGARTWLPGDHLRIDPRHQGTSSGLLPAEPRGGWISGNQIWHKVAPPGTTRTQILILWGPALYEHVGERLRGDQVARKVDPWGPSLPGSWSPGDRLRPSAGWSARRVGLW